MVYQLARPALTMATFGEEDMLRGFETCLVRTMMAVFQDLSSHFAPALYNLVLGGRADAKIKSRVHGVRVRHSNT